jgi:hypothetical protein
VSIWGPGSFENDDGADWFADLEENPRLELVQEALSEVAEPEHVGYLDAADCCQAIAAAEVLAEVVGVPGRETALDAEAADRLREALARENVRDRRKLLRQAVNALEVVLNDEENSELRHLWEEDGDRMQVWVETVKSLEYRLRKAVVG